MAEASGQYLLRRYCLPLGKSPLYLRNISELYGTCSLVDPIPQSASSSLSCRLACSNSELRLKVCATLVQSHLFNTSNVNSDKRGVLVHLARYSSRCLDTMGWCGSCPESCRDLPMFTESSQSSSTSVTMSTYTYVLCFLSWF